MFEIWYVLKFTYTEEQDRGHPLVGMLAYENLDEAKGLFNELQASYRFNMPIRIKGGKVITVTDAWLYESFKFLYSDALKAANSDEATLMYRAEGIDLDLQKATSSIEVVRDDA